MRLVLEICCLWVFERRKHTIAGRHRQLEIIALVAGASDHSAKHGEQVLQKLLAMQAMPKAKASSVKAAVKRVSCSALPFIRVDLEGEQIVAMKSVTVSPLPTAACPLGSAWRVGFNINPTDLETKMISLLDKA